jgi:hypothetical protein
LKDFLFSNWPSILIIVAFLFWVGYLVVNRKWDQLRSMAYRMILQAEKVITGTKRGQERFELVFERVYSLIPPWLRFFILKSDLREQLQEWYNDIKDYLDNGKMDGST